jgi:L-ectoine synthase
MIIRTLKEAENSKRRVTSKGWESVRLLLKEDNVGFSFHITTIFQGAMLEMQYKHHFESVYCIQGEGEIILAENKESHPVSPGTIYVLDKHDKHILYARTEMKLACVFNPALHGNEVHDDSGSYPDLSNINTD